MKKIEREEIGRRLNIGIWRIERKKRELRIGGKGKEKKERNIEGREKDF